MICVQLYKQTFLFDIIQDFGGDYEDYLIGIRDIKAQNSKVKYKHCRYSIRQFTCSSQRSFS